MGKRLISQRRGRYSSNVYQSPSHRHKGGKNGIKYLPMNQLKSKIIDIEHDPGRTAPIAKAKIIGGDKDGQNYILVASEGMHINQEINFGDTAEISAGNVLPLKQIPEGTPIFNIEAQPGDGGKFVRAGGTVAMVVSHGNRTVVQLPSGQFKKFHAFRSRAKKYPRVSGVAMNPVDHPHGGGSHQHVGKASTVSRHAPPGRKVGRLSPKKRKKK